jgi:hypothetical protein
MKPIVEQVLASGLVDRSVAELMENWGYLEPGSADKTNENKLKNATVETLTKLASDLAVEVEKEHAIRETYLDLERIRWPAMISGIYEPAMGQPKTIVGALSAVMDRMGRYYFRAQDVNEKWFVPGYILERYTANKTDGIRSELVRETIFQATVLFIGDQGVCIQVTTNKG